MERNVRTEWMDAKTGKIYYDAVKVKGMMNIFSSPISANAYVYIIDRRGNCSVIKEGTEFVVRAQNKLDDEFDASPVIIEKDLLLRGFKNLYCISE